jgi:hypothetical protein
MWHADEGGYWFAICCNTNDQITCLQSNNTVNYMEYFNYLE